MAKSIDFPPSVTENAVLESVRACQTVATATTSLNWSCKTRMTPSINSPVTSASHTSPRGHNSSTTMTRSVPTEAQQNIPSFGELSYQEGGSELPDAMTDRTRPASKYAEPKIAPPYVRIQNVEGTTPGNPAHSTSGLASSEAKLERSLGLNQDNQNVDSTSGSSIAESNPHRPGLCRVCRKSRHLGRVCPEKYTRPCRNCGTLGHWIRECPKA